jgi:DNA replication protein DnaC
MNIMEYKAQIQDFSIRTVSVDHQISLINITEHWKVVCLMNKEHFISQMGKRKNPPQEVVEKNKKHKKISYSSIVDFISEKQKQKKIFLSINENRKIKKNLQQFENQGFMDFDLNIKPLSEEFTQSAMGLATSLSEHVKSIISEELRNKFSPENVAFSVGKAAALIAISWLAVKCSLSALKQIVKFLFSMCFEQSSADVFSNQSFDTQSPAEFAINAISTLLGIMSMKDFSPARFSEFIMKHSKLASGLKGVAFNAVDIFKNAINMFRSYVLDLPPYFTDSSSEIQVTSWIDSIRDYEIKEAKKELTINADNYEALQSLIVSGRLLQKRYNNMNREYDNVRISIRAGIGSLEKLMEVFKKSSFDKTKLRPKPFTLLLKGKSGVGKSAITVPLLNAIMCRTIRTKEELLRYKKNNMDFIYSRAAETGFWDGYCGQKVVVMDDFMQVDELKASSNLANEAFDMIRASNVFPHLLHKAHLDDKGNSYFEGRIILCSTNNWRMQSQILIEPEALIRRFDTVVEIYPKLEYCKPNTIDGPLTSRRLDAKGEFSTDIYEFHVMNGQSATVMTYEELIEHCVTTYNQISEWGHDYLEKVQMKCNEEADKAEQFFDASTFEPQGPTWSHVLGSRKLRSWATKTGMISGPEFDLALADFVNVVGNLPAFFYTSKDFVSFLCGNIIDKQYDGDYPRSKYTLQWRYIMLLSDPSPANRDQMSVIWDKLNNSLATFEPQGFVEPRNFMGIDLSEVSHEDWFNELQAEADEERKKFDVITSKWSYVKTRIAESFDFIAKKVLKWNEDYPWVKWLLGIVSLVGLGISFLRNKEETFELDSGQAGQRNLRGPVARAKNARKAPRSMQNLKMFFDMQSGIHPQTEEIVSKTTANSAYIMTFADFSVRIGGALAIKGTTFMLNAHFYDNLKKILQKEPKEKVHFCPVTVWGQGCHTECCFEVSLKQLLKVAPTATMIARDAWIVNIPGICRDHKDISHLFITEKNLERYESGMPLVTYYAKAPGEGSSKAIESRSPIGSIMDTLGMTRYPTAKFVYPSVHGDCGSICYLNEHSKMGSIAGIHGAGNGSTAVVIIITAEWLKENLEVPVTTCDKIFFPQGFGDYRPLSDEDYKILGKHRVVGVVKEDVHLARNTKLRKSFVYDCFSDFYKADKQPAQLKPVDGEDPFDIATDRYATYNYIPDMDTLTAASIHYCDRLLEIPATSKNILSFEESCTGIDGEPFVNAVCRKTSSGYPWVLDTLLPGKKDFFGDEQEYQLTSVKCKELRERVDYIIEEAKKGHRLTHIYIDSLKDELRPSQKVKELKTRMISCCPLDYTVAFRMYFGRFMDFMMKNRIYNGSAVGINPVSVEWTHLVNHLSQKGDNFVAGDFSSFDAHQNSAVLGSVLKIVNIWYNDGNDLIRKVLWKECVNSKHLRGKTVVEWNHCLPSGHPMTSISNTIYTNLLIRCCWIEIFGSIYSIQHFDDHVSYVGYGDDNIMGISNLAVENFNYDTIIEAMGLLGMTYTNEDKTANKVLSKNIEECSFLKRGFVQEPCGVWMAPLSLETILEMPYWYRNGPDVFQRVKDNSENALKEATLHGEGVFECVRSCLNHTSKQNGQPLGLYNSFEFYKLGLASDWSFLTSQTELSDFLYNIETIKEIEQGSAKSVHSYSQDGEKVQDVSYSLQMGVVEGRKISPAKTENNNDDRRESDQSAGTTLSTETLIVGKELVEQNTDEQNTGFTQDANTRLGQPFDIHNISALRDLRLGNTFLKDSVKQFLETPFRIMTWDVTGSETTGTTLPGNFALPFDSAFENYSTPPTQDNQYGIMMQRLTAYSGFRGTAVLRFQVNCQRFAQGRMLIHYIPGQNDSVDEGRSHRFDLRTKSQLPRCEINLNRDTTTIFRVPYVSAYGYYRLNSGALPENRPGIMGRVFPVVYSPLVGASNLKIHVWLHFEDIELLYPTYAPQSGMKAREQMSGLISGPLNAVSKASRNLAAIPSLSAICSSIGKGTLFLSRSAAAFGWSKPNNLSVSDRVALCPNSDHLNVDVPENNAKLSLTRSQEIPLMSGFAGNDVDEMSFEYLCRRPAYQTNFSWAAASLSGTQLLMTDLGPWNFGTTYTVDTYQVRTMSPFALVAASTGLWRADIVVTLKIVKTEFHTGRLRICFMPNRDGGAAFTYASSIYGFRHIVDIRESDTFMFKIPYCGQTPMLNFGDSIGKIGMFVENSLEQPSTVSSTIDCIVEVSAENTCFAGVTNRQFTPVIGNGSGFIPQSGLHDSDENCQHVVQLGDMASEPAENISVLTCGEVVRSVKQLMLRKCFTNGWRNTTANTRTVTFKPFTVGGAFITTVANTIEYSSLGGDKLATWSSCFLLSRGGVRYTIPVLNTIDHVYAGTKLDNTLSVSRPAYQASTTSESFQSGTVPFVSRTQGYLNFEVPQWSKFYARENTTIFRNGDTNVPIGSGQQIANYGISSASTDGTIIKLARSAADDYTLGFFIGVPVMRQDDSYAPY